MYNIYIYIYTDAFKEGNSRVCMATADSFKSKRSFDFNVYLLCLFSLISFGDDWKHDSMYI